MGRHSWRVLTTSIRSARAPLPGSRSCARIRRRIHLPLPWFRRKKSEQAQPIPAAKVEAPKTEVPAPPAEGEQPAAKKRRRGNRGGRGRRKTGAAASASAATTVKAETKRQAPA